jgi:spermidine/putrescine transport system ATP-binding protein
MSGGSIIIENLYKEFDDKIVLKNTNLEIKSGEFFSLLGPSGCGKTTLLRLLAGFEDPTRGTIKIDGEDVSKLAPNQRHINTIFQNYALFPHLSVFENVAFSLRLKNTDQAVVKKEVSYFLELVKLQEHANKKPAQLSGGMKQRVAIARALINRPSVLLLDEPLSALDAKLRQHMLIELDLIHDEVGITFIFVTHDQQEALSVSDRIAVMHEGHILQVGTPTEIYEAPINTFVADFIGESNFIEGRVEAVEGRHALIDVTELGTIKIEMDKPVAVGDHVRTTIRPEKIVISREKPAPDDDLNTIEVVVDELIYNGFQTKYFTKTLCGNIHFRVFKQHTQFRLNEGEIGWHEKAFISWDANDGYIVDIL